MVENSFGFEKFLQGIAFGFDLGTNSIGYAVRKSKEIVEAGVIVIPHEAKKIQDRRGRRSMRRARHNLQQRLRWFDKQMREIGIYGELLIDPPPVYLREKAVKGERLTPAELYTALRHLFKKRGHDYDVPWATGKDKKAQTDEDNKANSRLVDEGFLKKHGCAYPCQFLADRLRHKQRVKGPDYKIHRSVVEKEFWRIIETQKAHYPQLGAEKNGKSYAKWLAYGDCVMLDGYPVYFKKSVVNRGMLGLMHPRFSNRSPGLDRFKPYDEEGRPRHVVRRNSNMYKDYQFELAIRDFRVVDKKTGKKTVPPPEYIQVLRDKFNEGRSRTVTLAQMKKLAEPYRNVFELDEWQEGLTVNKEDKPGKGSLGRARVSAATLREWHRDILNADGITENPQPLLQRPCETKEQALERLFQELAFPLGEHRLRIFAKLLKNLIKKHGEPDFIVNETIRELGIGEKAKRVLNTKRQENTSENERARDFLTENGLAMNGTNIRKYRLWKETGGKCPYCGDNISVNQFPDAVIEHIVPQQAILCNEFFNLTIAHFDCNQKKGGRTPYQAFSVTEEWEVYKQRVGRYWMRKIKKGGKTIGRPTLKYRLATEENAEECLREKYNAPLTQTSYIARLARQVCLILCGWLGKDGRDPANIPGAQSNRYFATNGGNTSELRRQWGLHRVLTGARDTVAKKKARYDVRNHAIDAMVIACTDPRLARQVSRNTPYWRFDRSTGEVVGLNPFDLTFSRAKETLDAIAIRHHTPTYRHAQHYDETMYGKRISIRDSEERELFIVRRPVEVITKKKIVNGRIHPPDFCEYLQAALAKAESEGGEIDAPGKQLFPRLCGGHYLRWRSKGKGEFAWPTKVKCPIRHAKEIKSYEPSAYFEIRDNVFIERTGFKQVRVFQRGNRYYFKHLPYWEKDCPQLKKSKRKPNRARYIMTMRTNDVIKLRKGVENHFDFRPGLYRIMTIGQNGQIHIVPAELSVKADKKTVAEIVGKKSGFYAPMLTGIMPYIERVE